MSTPFKVRVVAWHSLVGEEELVGMLVLVVPSAFALQLIF